MQTQILKEEIRKLKQQISQTELQITVHKAISSGAETILQAPTNETLQAMYSELLNLGITDPQDAKKKKRPSSIYENMNKITASSRMDTDLAVWLEKIQSKENGSKNYLRKEPRLKKKTPGKKPYNPMAELRESSPDITVIPDKEAFHTPLRSSRTDKKLSSSTKKRISGSGRSSRETPIGKSLKREHELIKDAPFDVPVWKKRRSMVHMGVDELFEFCQKIMSSLLEHESGWPFLAPVDVVALRLPDYLTIITHPMDLGTINRKLNDQEYRRIGEFIIDVRLVWSNCKRYNNEQLEVHKLAVLLEKLFEEKLLPILPYVEHNAPLLKNETLQKSIAQLLTLQAKLSKQAQQAQQIQQKPKQPHLVDASPPIVSRDAVPNSPLLPEQYIILAEDVQKLEMKYMKGLVQIISEDAENLLKSDSNVVEVNLGNLDSITIRRIVQYVEDCRTDRRLRKNQSRRKHRESKAAAGGTTSRSNNRNNRGGNRGGNYKENKQQVPVNDSESESDSSSSDSSDSDSEENTPKKQKKQNKMKDTYGRGSTTLTNSGFEMGGDESGLTDFNSSSTWIGEDAFTNETNLEQGTGKVGSIWEDLQDRPETTPKPKKKEEKKKEEKPAREEKRRQTKVLNAPSQSKNKGNNNNNGSSAYESTMTLSGQANGAYGALSASGSAMYGAAAMASAVGMSATASMYGGMNPYAGYGMYGMPNSSLYGMNPATLGLAGATPTAGANGASPTPGAATSSTVQQSQMSAYQYQQYQQYQYQQYQYQQYQYQYQQQLLAQQSTQPAQTTSQPSQ